MVSLRQISARPGEGSGTHRGGGDNKDQAGRREKDKELFRFKKRTGGENEPTFPSSVCTDFNPSECL